MSSSRKATLMALVVLAVVLLLALEAQPVDAFLGFGNRDKNDGGKSKNKKNRPQQQPTAFPTMAPVSAPPSYNPEKPFYPVHPRVNINWTQGSLNTNTTLEEKKQVFRDKLVLTKLIVVNRHGHRAPNAPYWDVCPNDAKNRKRYNIDAEDLSGLGMQEEYEFGQYLRSTYADFLGPRFNRTLHFFRAVGEPRILQSAMAVAQGVFPDGFGPGGFLPSRPQYVPVFSDMDTHEYLLDDVPCFRRAEADSERWIANNFANWAADSENAAVFAKMREVCGEPRVNLSEFKYMKTVSDGMIFNTDYGLRVGSKKTGSLTSDWLFRIRNASMQLLLQRLYNTDEQQTYTVVDLPRTILQQLNHTHLAQGQEVNDFRETRHESSFYFVHRESLYALAQFFGFGYRVPGLPRGEVPVAASLVIEKLMPKRDQYSHDESKLYLRISLYTPYHGVMPIPIPACRIPELCELGEIRAIYQKRIDRTGSWETLCGYSPQEMNHTTDVR